MVTSCEINFDQNPNGTYFAGQMVSGTVILKTDKVKIVKGFALKIKGLAATRWSDDQGTGENKKSITFQGTEDYIASTTYLLGSEESQTVQIEPGIHTFTFACGIPPLCPSSFEGKMGYIRYIVKAQLVRPWKYDQTYTRAFTVLKLMDLNYESPAIRVPTGQKTSQTFCCGPCSSPPLTVNVMIPQSGFVPGQNIPITVAVKNESYVPVKDVKISFIMFAILFSQQPSIHSRSEKTNLVKIRGGAVGSKSTRTINHSIRVPAVPPTCYHLCRILHVAYQIDVEIKLKGMHNNPFMSIPVIIGNVPLVSVVQHQPRPHTNDFQRIDASAPEESGINSHEEGVRTVSDGSFGPVTDSVLNSSGPLSLIDLNIPPPSYEQAACMTRANCNEDDQHALAKSDFIPSYPVYNINEPPTEEDLTSTNINKSTWL